MTIEELDIIVSASIEPALKEIKKLMPQIKQHVTQAVEVAQKSMQEVDMKKVSNKIQQSVQQIKAKIEKLKKSNKDSVVEINVNNKEAQKQISQLEKQIDSLQKKISASQMKLSVITPQLDSIAEKTIREFTPEGISSDNPAIQKTIDNSLASNKEYTSLLKQENKLTQEIHQYNTQLEEARNKASQLKQEISYTSASQNKLTSFFSNFKEKLEQAKSTTSNIKDFFSKIPNITQKITKNIKNMRNDLKLGLKHVIKYAGALFSLRSIYGVLSSSASSWLSSQNSGAKQLSANIEYMKYAMGSVFAPVIEYVINLVYKLMKAIQSVVYAFTGINVFAKATAASMNKAAGSASKASKSLSGVHNEINNVSENKNTEGTGVATPSIDLSQTDKEMSIFAKRLHKFFEPLVTSWKTYGAKLIKQVKTTAIQIGNLFSNVWESVENIITNGTIYFILQNILAIIGNIAQAFANAWNYNGNGTIIVQNLAIAFNNLLIAINNVVKNEKFQKWLNWCSEQLKQISEKLASINWQPLIDALIQIGTKVGSIALVILNGLTSVFKWFVENPIVAEILLAIAIATGIVVAAIKAYNIVTQIAAVVTYALEAGLLPIIGVILAIIAVIALIIVAIMNWESIMNWLKQTVETVINAVIRFFTDLWNKVSFIFEAIWDVISTIFGFIWNIFATVFNAIWNIVSPILNAIWSIISTIFGAIWNIISTTLSSVWNVFSQIFNWIWQLVSIVFQGIWNIISPIINKVWQIIKTVLNKIQEVWSNIWNGIKNVVNSVWNGIWSIIKGVVNKILRGIESFVNGTIRGINKILSGISKVANAVGSLIGIKPINLQLSTISLPRLAKGGVIDNPTIAMMGEYSGAKTNPEIVTPQNIMYDTMVRALSDTDFNNGNNGQPIYLTVNVGNERLGRILLNDLRNMTRQTGQGIEALVGG